MRSILDSKSSSLPVAFLAATLALAAAACGDDGGDDGSAGPDASNVQVGDVPNEPNNLFTFLSSGDYTSFAAESAVHGPTLGSPHSSVRVFVNGLLDASLRAGNSSHPIGSSSVKELYSSDGSTLRGWAVMVKTQQDSDNGRGWYWYEVFSTTDGSNPAVSANGASACTGCHASGGSDFFRSNFPLE